MEVRRGNHTVYTINYHFVWCPKYRHAILDKIEPSLERSIREVAERYGYDVLSLHIAPDHVYLFLSAHPKHAPSDIVRTIKRFTAREMWEQHESLLARVFWGGGFWECSFYVGRPGK
jgi:putative transposase